jgi:hypothetical protein
MNCLSGGTPLEGLRAKLKALDPLTSSGPGLPADILERNGDRLRVHTERAYFPRTLVQVIVNRTVLMGEVAQCAGAEGRFLIDVNLWKR